MKVYGIEAKWIDEGLGLLMPNFERTNAGVIPAMLKGLNVANMDFGELLQDKITNKDVEEQLKKSFPNGYDNIIFLLCDGVGVERLEDIQGLIWENINPADPNSQGTVANSVFPTMTTTNMTSLAYGTLPCDHGFVGYNIYNEAIDTIFNGLNGKYLDGNGSEKSIHTDFDVATFVSGTPITHSIFRNTKLPLTFFVPAQQPREGLLTLITDETPLTAYENGQDLAQKLIHQLNQAKDNQFIIGYIGDADYAGHLAGPKSEHYTMAIKGIEQLIGALLNHPKITNGSTLVILTSDHGQSQIDHSISRWLTKEEIKTYQEQGVTLSTSGRVIHAYCKSEKNDLALEILNSLSQGDATILEHEDAIELFGGQNVKQFSKRIGQFVFLPKDGYLCDVPEVVLLDKNQRLHGQHGSLSKQELYVPVGIWGGTKVH